MEEINQSESSKNTFQADVNLSPKLPLKRKTSNTRIVSIVVSIVAAIILIFFGGVQYLFKHGNISVIGFTVLVIFVFVAKYLEDRRKNKSVNNPNQLSQSNLQEPEEQFSIAKVGGTVAITIMALFFGFIILIILITVAYFIYFIH